MSETIIFRGAVAKHLDLRQGKEGREVFTRIHMSAEFSDLVREKMEWEDPGESVTSAKLTGELLAQNFILTPSDKNLAGFELQMAISDVTDFQVVALKDDEGEVCGRQLRFIVRSPGDGVEALVGQYIRRVGRHEGQLRISYEPLAKQEPLPLGTGTDANAQGELDTGCVACNNRIPFAEGSDTVHASGTACTKAATSGPALASANQMQHTAVETAKRAARPRAN